MGPAGASDIFLVAVLTFDSMKAVQTVLGSAEGQATVADLPTFATSGVEILMCDTRIV